jgi:hypothetical protein
MGPHVVDILRQGLSVVLDVPANTVSYRAWMRLLITQADVAHELHVLDFRRARDWRPVTSARHAAWSKYPPAEPGALF